MDGYQTTRLIALLGALILVAPALVYILRDKGASLRYAVVWAAIVAAVVVLWMSLGR